MKSQVQKMIAAVGLVALCGTFLMMVDGCGGLGLPNLGSIFPGAGGTGSLLVGTWKTQSITDGTNSVNCPGTLSDSNGTFNCEQEVRNYLSNGTWITTAPADLIGQGTWTINSNTLTVTNGTTSFSGTVTFSADQKTLYWDVNGITTVAAKQ